MSYAVRDVREWKARGQIFSVAPYVSAAPNMPLKALVPDPTLEYVLRQWADAMIHYARPVGRRQETIEERFRRLAKRWRAETAHASLVREMALHPAYQQIIGFGSFTTGV